MPTLKYVVEFLDHPLQTASATTIACTDTFAAMIEFFQAEKAIVDPDMFDELNEIIEAGLSEYGAIPDMTPHYRISATHGKRARTFVDQ